MYALSLHNLCRSTRMHLGLLMLLLRQVNKVNFKMHDLSSRIQRRLKRRTLPNMLKAGLGFGKVNAARNSDKIKAQSKQTKQWQAYSALVEPHISLSTVDASVVHNHLLTLKTHRRGTHEGGEAGQSRYASSQDLLRLPPRVNEGAPPAPSKKRPAADTKTVHKIPADQAFTRTG